jgi:carbon-monoxide dehydrogenase small subunit
MMMTARALLNRDPHPSEPAIREAISGQICRCTGYATIVRSIQWAAAHEAGTAEGAAADGAELADADSDAAVPVGGAS